MSLLCLLAAEPELHLGMAAREAWLTPTEQARLQSLGTPARRDTFLAGRWLARLAVQRWLGMDGLPALEVAESGACHVLGIGGVHVSISHSAGAVACAVSGLPVGVDVESLLQPRDHLALAEIVHSPAQREQLAAAPGDAAAAFLQLWTLKEAWLKARERGLDFALMRSLVVDDGPQGDVAVAMVGDLVLAVAGNPGLPSHIDGPANAGWCRGRMRVAAA
ncbi:ACP synthase 2 [Pelomonas sp. HMWF004]|nr:ACP synthase 2 [Pelomonas sp. HMWF004]